jgi:membrane protein implicated in regulation of membrane protease activity
VIPTLVLQLVGLVALIVGVWQVYGGWHALAAFGFALLATTELRVRRPRLE